MFGLTARTLVQVPHVWVFCRNSGFAPRCACRLCGPATIGNLFMVNPALAELNPKGIQQVLKTEPAKIVIDKCLQILKVLLFKCLVNRCRRLLSICDLWAFKGFQLLTRGFLGDVFTICL